MSQVSTSWALVALVLGIVSVGPGNLIILLFCLLSGVLGLLVILGSISKVKHSGLGDLWTRSRQFWRSTKPLERRAEALLATDPALTGIEPIDAELNVIVNYVFRDYVHKWLFNLTQSNEFPAQVRECLQVAIQALSDRIRDVDWIPFLTTRVVDDVASHVRLFKTARLLLKTRNKEDSGSKPQNDLESTFFEAEINMEGDICRDLVSTICQEEISYLQDVSDLLLFLLLPKVDFQAHSLRTLTRELLVNVVLKPILDLVSDPDFLNQSIVWLYQDYDMKQELFATTLRHSECIEELQATREIVSREISILRSNDSRGEEDSSLKQQLNSLLSLRKAIDARIHRLQSGSETDSIGLPAQVDWNQTIGPGLELFSLPVEVLLKNNVALSYFIDFMTSIGYQAYIFFYLNIEGWKVSAEQQLHALELEAFERSQRGHLEDEDFVKVDKHRETVIENMREAAHSIYEEYLSEKANPRLRIDDSVVKRILFKIRTEPPDPDWFSEVQEAVFEKLQTEESFLEAFKKSVGYAKLLAELDLLKDSSGKDVDGDDSSSLGGDEFSIYDSLSLNSCDGGGPGSAAGDDPDLTLTPGSTLLPPNASSGGKDSDSGLGASIVGGPTTHESANLPSASNPSVTSVRTHKRIGSDCSTLQPTRGHRRNASQSSLGASGSMSLPPYETTNTPLLSADVAEVESMREGGKTFASYRIVVRSRDPRGYEEVKSVYRRYSDFYALHDQVQRLFPTLAKTLAFPSKKTFGNMDSAVLKKRLKMLHTYLQELLKMDVLQQNVGLLEILQKFLNQESYEKERSQASNVARAVGSVKNSVKNVSNAVTSVPGQLFHRVDTVVDGVSKLLQTKPIDPEFMIESNKVGASLVNESTENNIPLRIILLFMDEVFDLRERNTWLRRYIVAFLRQVLKAMFGDIVNRRIVEYFAHLTSPVTLSTYLKSIKESLWPDGFPAEHRPAREENRKMRTRVAAKVALFSSLSEDLKHAIGSETSRSGLQMLFDMIQHPVLNKRLTFVLLEGFLDTLFREQDFPALFQKLHSRSSRVKNKKELRNSQRTQSDLRIN